MDLKKFLTQIIHNFGIETFYEATIKIKYRDVHPDYPLEVEVVYPVKGRVEANKMQLDEASMSLVVLTQEDYKELQQK